MIQGGCPLGTGTGGPGYKFEDETKNGLKFNKPGLLKITNENERGTCPKKEKGTHQKEKADRA